MEQESRTKLSDASPEEWDQLDRQTWVKIRDDIWVETQEQFERVMKVKREELLKKIGRRELLVKKESIDELSQSESGEIKMLCEKVKKKITKREFITADKIMEQGVSEMKSRASTYDAEGGERSMSKTVDMFNALTSGEMSEEQGWKFMCCLKLVRSEQGDYRDDSYVDGAAYFALAGETASNTR